MRSFGIFAPPVEPSEPLPLNLVWAKIYGPSASFAHFLQKLRRSTKHYMIALV